MLLFADPGGEQYFSLGLTASGIWDIVNGGSLSNAAPAGRATQFGISLNGSGNGLTKFLNASYSSLVPGVAIYIPALWLNTNPTPIIQLLDTGSNQCDLRVNSSGQLIFTRNGSQLGSPSANQITNGSGWHYFEAAFVVGSSVTLQAWVDGVSWLTVNTVNSQSTGNASANQVRFYNGNQTAISYWKDFYILDTSHGINVARLGDISVQVKYPSGAGVNSAWAANTGTALAAVQDGTTHTGTWPDGDTTYIADSTPGDVSDFAHQALALTGNIFGVIHQSYMRKDDAGTRSVAQVCLSNGSLEQSPTIGLGNTYTYYTDILEIDPHTSSAWTVSGYNAATFGVKEIS